MQRMLRINPFQLGADPPCGHNEGLIFSDIRFRIALVLRSKNPHVFRPDLLDSHIIATPEALKALSQSEALAKVSYVSETPIPDDRHLQFLVYLVESLSHLTHGVLAFDVPGERLFFVDELREQLKMDLNAKRLDLHLGTFWSPDEEGGHAFTRGLRKIGFPDLATPVSNADHRVLICELLSNAAQAIWHDRTFQTQRVLTAFGDTFDATFRFRSKQDALVQISRKT